MHSYNVFKDGDFTIFWKWNTGVHMFFIVWLFFYLRIFQLSDTKFCANVQFSLKGGFPMGLLNYIKCTDLIVRGFNNNLENGSLLIYSSNWIIQVSKKATVWYRRPFTGSWRLRAVWWFNIFFCWYRKFGIIRPRGLKNKSKTSVTLQPFTKSTRFWSL